MPDERRREYPVGVFLVVVFMNMVVSAGVMYYYFTQLQPQTRAMCEARILEAERQAALDCFDGLVQCEDHDTPPERIVPNDLDPSKPEQHHCSDYEIDYYTRSKINGKLIRHHTAMKCPLWGRAVLCAIKGD